MKNNHRDFCRCIWHLWSPTWQLDDATFERTAASWDSPGWVEVVLHSYCFRWGAASPDPRYAALEKQLEPQPKIGVPTTMLHGELEGLAWSLLRKAKSSTSAGRMRAACCPAWATTCPARPPTPL